MNDDDGWFIKFIPKHFRFNLCALFDDGTQIVCPQQGLCIVLLRSEKYYSSQADTFVERAAAALQVVCSSTQHTAAAGQRLSTEVRPPGVIMSSLWCVKNAKKAQELLIRSIARQVHEERVKCVRRCLHQQQLSPVTTPQWLYVAGGQDDAVLSHSHLNAILVTNLVNNNLILYLGTL